MIWKADGYGIGRFAREESDYCSLTVYQGMSLLRMRLIKIFVCIRLREVLVKFIQSPSGFTVPSYSLVFTNIDGVV